jgi:serine/threonine-protein kinase
MNITVGTKLGKYCLERPIGSGGNGFVWSARNESTAALVAGKVLVAPAGSAPARRFRQEARIGAWLAHRNIVRVFDLVEDETPSAMMLVMERLRGETLNRVLDNQTRLSPRSAVAVVMGVLSALTHAHGEGVVHRDVKPSNVLLSIESDGVMIPKLLDFGIAKVAGQEDEDGVLVGTPEYMSPEQIKGKDVDARSDVFATGTLLYEALTGRCPFEADTLSAALAAILYRPLKQPPEICDALWSVLERALARKLTDRYPSARAFSLALQDALNATPEELLASLQRIPVSVPTAALPPRFVSTPPVAFPPPSVVVSPACSISAPPAAAVSAAPSEASLEGDRAHRVTLPSLSSIAEERPLATERRRTWLVAAGATVLGLVSGGAAYWAAGHAARGDEVRAAPHEAQKQPAQRMARSEAPRR